MSDKMSMFMWSLLGIFMLTCMLPITLWFYLFGIWDKEAREAIDEVTLTFKPWRWW